MDKFKVADVQQAKIMNIFRNAKLKLLKIKAAIWFNKISRTMDNFKVADFCIYSSLPGRSEDGQKW
jgi:hypothetical protein